MFFASNTMEKYKVVSYGPDRVYYFTTSDDSNVIEIIEPKNSLKSWRKCQFSGAVLFAIGLTVSLVCFIIVLILYLVLEK